MPDRSFESLRSEDLSRAQKYNPGYDWVPGRFGPPPGVPRAKKEQLDRMNDRDFMNAVMRMRQEEKESLMIAESERRRTFGYLWPNPDYISYKDLAREGFYYSGVSDRVQCAFCAGTLGNWERGDIPSQSHKKFFSYCKMAQRKPCSNIPMSEDSCQIPEFNTDLLSARLDASNASVDPYSANDLGIESNQPTHSRYKILSNRLGTYKHYASSHPMKPEDLSTAGFFYEGPGDKVRCFWCDGALELWCDGDDAWTEHSKWYPGCSFLKLNKGKDFVKKCRSTLTSDELSTAAELEYNSSGTKFLLIDDTEEGEEVSVSDITAYDSFQTCKSLGFEEDTLNKIFSLNEYRDFTNVQKLIDALKAEAEGDSVSLEKVIEAEKPKSGDDDMECDQMTASSDRTYVDVCAVVKDAYEADEVSAALLVDAMYCHQCRQEPSGAIVLPCGHLVLCQKCSLRKLPANCTNCGGTVRGACRVFMG